MGLVPYKQQLFGYAFSGKRNKSKNKPLYYIKLKKLLHSKGNQQMKIKWQPTK